MMQTTLTEHEMPLLADTLRLLLPPREVTLLLRAGLLPGDAAGRAWRDWLGTVDDPKAFLAADRIGIKRHLPLIYHNLTRHGTAIGRELEPYLRASRAREEMRSVRYRRFLHEALDALHRAGIDFLLGRGVTLGELVCDDPVLRHSHDVDLLVPYEQVNDAITALRSAGFVAPSRQRRSDEPRVDHESGLPVELHARLYRTPFYDCPLEDVRKRSRPVEVLGIPARAMSAPDMLVQISAHASTVRQRRALSWIVDSMVLMRQGPGLDWDAVLAIARQSRVSLPLYVMHRYLLESFDAPIPAEALDALRREACDADGVRVLAAIDGLRAEPTMRMKTILHAGGGASRRAIVRHCLLPPWAYLRGRYAHWPAWALPAQYPARPLRFAAQQAGKRLSRLRPARPTLDNDATAQPVSSP